MAVRITTTPRSPPRSAGRRVPSAAMSGGGRSPSISEDPPATVQQALDRAPIGGEQRRAGRLGELQDWAAGPGDAEQVVRHGHPRPSLVRAIHDHRVEARQMGVKVELERPAARPGEDFGACALEEGDLVGKTQAAVLVHADLAAEVQRLGLEPPRPCGELVHLDRAAALERDLPALADADLWVVRKRGMDRLVQDAVDQELSGRGQRCQPGAPVDHVTVDVDGAVDTDLLDVPKGQARPRGQPAESQGAALDLDSGPASEEAVGEGRQHTVAERLDHLAAERLDDPSAQEVVAKRTAPALEVALVELEFRRLRHVEDADGAGPSRAAVDGCRPHVEQDLTQVNDWRHRRIAPVGCRTGVYHHVLSKKSVRSKCLDSASHGVQTKPVANRRRAWKAGAIEASAEPTRTRRSRCRWCVSTCWRDGRGRSSGSCTAGSRRWSRRSWRRRSSGSARSSLRSRRTAGASAGCPPRRPAPARWRPGAARPTGSDRPGQARSRRPRSSGLTTLPRALRGSSSTKWTLEGTL